ncbi:MAG: T9SS type A sorting domain-containing protein [Chitinivibrionia bacterium]|nr:T9SS type A sorting domain-containing protein [Chitinivibrionia bacterium]
MSKKTKTISWGGVGIALLFTTSAAFAQYTNYAFPSPMPPTQDTTGVKQIVSFIWDDNAYSGKNGSNYEGPAWMKEPAFKNIAWVGGVRAEAAWVFPGPNLNDLNIDEKDCKDCFGMAWAAKKLAGYDGIKGYPIFNPQFLAAYKEGDKFVAVSESTGKLGVYVMPFGGTAFSFSYPSGKGVDEISFDGSYQVSSMNWQTGQMESKPIGDWKGLDWGQKNDLIQSGKFIFKTDEEPIFTSQPKKNPDGSSITMTFNIISGQIIPAVNRMTGNAESSANRQSKWGYWIPNGLYSSTDFGGVAISWGREYPIMLNSWDSNKNDKLGSGYYMDYTVGDAVNGRMQVNGFLNAAYQEAADLGHEIGNHTIDHLETNSMLPYKAGSGATAFPGFANAADNTKLMQSTAFKDGFGRWADANGGYDFEGIDRVTMPDGEVLEINEATEFGQASGAPQQFMGWVSYAGKILSKEAWAGLIGIGEEEIRNYLDISKQSNEVVSFRAPRLEVNSNMFWALKEWGYLYDCGNEEGYEYNVDGTNHLWPYTMDNGSPNVAWQRMIGENKSNFDSLPYGFWQYPVSVLIVPNQNWRGEMYDRYVQINGYAPVADDKESFIRNGKLTGFDFNLFILYGATKAQALETLKYSLDKRKNGGRAPMQVGCHSDYFTPIYDNATLMNAANKNTYGKALNYNTWKDRIATFEEFRDYGLQQGAYFWDGKKTIEYIKTLVASAKKGQDIKPITNLEFFSHNSKSTVSGDLASGATITTQSAKWETAGYVSYGNAGDFEFDHISLEYSTTAPLTIRLITDDPVDEEYPYEVTLNNLNAWDASALGGKPLRYAVSGDIPLSAFQRNNNLGYDDGNGAPYPDLVGLKVKDTEWTKSIKSIEIAVQVPTGKAQTTSLSIRNLQLFSGERTAGLTTGITKAQKANVIKTAVLGMTSNALKLNLSNTGVYNVDIITANGRVVKSFKSVNLNAGLNTLSLNGLAKGMYMVRIHNKNFNTSLKSLVL